ncbi:MAG: hypothetical protein L0271_21065, partial [Gemmatimonadetes bacterium]|nr:hypothetical protein [Gemmatimonadota bacterium]
MRRARLTVVLALLAWIGVYLGSSACSGSSSVVAPPDYQFRIVSGNDQSGQPGTTLPQDLVVEYKDAQGNPAPPTSVAWTSNAGLEFEFGITDAGTGRTTNRWTLSQFLPVGQVITVTATIAGEDPVTFRAIGRHGGGLEAVGFEYNGVRISQDTLTLFPGLCAVDSRENVDSMFAALARNGIRTARAGAYKPRTSPYDFQGLGAACLPYVFELAGVHGIRVVAVEVTRESHIEEIRKALAQSGDATGVMLQIGTRNAQNFELLKAVGQQTELPVLFKRGMGITLEES